MPIDYAQMRDCVLDALSEHVLTLDRPAEMVVTWADMKRRTQNAAIVNGMLDGAAVAFDEGEGKLFEQALWALFSEGILAPVFKAQRYGKKGWEEGEFKLTARGMRGFQASGPPTRDVDAFLKSLRQAGLGLAGLDLVLAHAEQAVRAVRADLHLAAALATGAALEVALAELVDAVARPTGPVAGVPALMACLEAALGPTPAAAEALNSLGAAAEGLPAVRDQAGRLVAIAPTAQEVDAGLAALPGCLERACALLRLAHLGAAS